MSKKVIIAIIIIAVLLIGAAFVYKAGQIRWGSRDSSRVASQEGKQSAVIPRDHVEYKNKQAGFSFSYPRKWRIEEAGYGDNRDVFYLILRSPDIKEEELEIGGTDVVKGALIYISVGDRDNKTLEQLYNVGLTAELINNGSVKPIDIQIGNNPGVEYSFAYEGPPSLKTVFLLGPNKYVSASLETEGNEREHSEYPTFKKILESIQVN